MHIAITVIFFAVVIFIKLKMPMWKGKYSEKLVNNKIQELPEEYVVFNDLLFESNGYSTQIDHIVVSPYGVLELFKPLHTDGIERDAQKGGGPHYAADDRALPGAVQKDKRERRITARNEQVNG